MVHRSELSLLIKPSAFWECVHVKERQVSVETLHARQGKRRGFIQ